MDRGRGLSWGRSPRQWEGGGDRRREDTRRGRKMRDKKEGKMHEEKEGEIHVKEEEKSRLPVFVFFLPSRQLTLRVVEPSQTQLIIN